VQADTLFESFIRVLADPNAPASAREEACASARTQFELWKAGLLRNLKKQCEDNNDLRDALVSLTCISSFVPEGYVGASTNLACTRSILQLVQQHGGVQPHLNVLKRVPDVSAWLRGALDTLGMNAEDVQTLLAAGVAAVVPEEAAVHNLDPMTRDTKN
jgi:hypothetical protein